MKELILKANGQEIKVYAEENELAKLTKPERAWTGYERVAMGQTYYAHEPTVDTRQFDNRYEYDDTRFAEGDYVNDRQLYDDRERAQILHDRLEQWQALNDEPVDWGDGENKYKIRFDYTSNKIVWLNTRYCRELNVVYFSTDEKAQEAIKVFHDELMWYYTKYRSRLDEKRTEANTQT